METSTTAICGNCTMCCKLLGFNGKLNGEQFKKPAGQWCPECDIGKGCKVYQDRPEPCRGFVCLYVHGILEGVPLDPKLRPDRCGVVLSPTTDDNIAVSVDWPRTEAWKREPVFSLLRQFLRAGKRATVSSGPSLTKAILRWQKGRIAITEMDFTEPDEQGMQWSVPGTEKAVGWL